MTVFGIDVSHYEAVLPDTSGYAFVFQKCTQGVTYVDPTYAGRHSSVRNSGKVFGAYHFMTMGDSGTAQVTWFAENAAVQPGDIVILDFEDDGTWSRYSPSDIGRMGTECINALRATYPRNRILLYCNVTTYSGIVVAESVPVGDGLWEAAYRSLPTGDPWLFWQYSDNPVDADQATAFSSFADLKNWSMGVTSPTTLDTEFSSFVPGSTVKAPLHNYVLTADQWAYLVHNQDVPALVAQIKTLSDQVAALQASVAKLNGSFTITGSGTIG